MISLLTNLLSFDWKRAGKKLLLWAVIPLVAWYVSLNWYQLMLIQGNSMEPAYHHFQVAMLNKHNKSYERGDVIAFFCETLNCVLVKRIAACPGDTLVIKNGTLYVNGVISEVYPQYGYFSYAGLLSDEITLSANSYLVLGDNASESKDSRYPEVGIIAAKDILGRIM